MTSRNSLIDLDDEMDDEMIDLERRLRNACKATIPRLLEVDGNRQPSVITDHIVEITPAGQSSLAPRWTLAVAGCLLVVLTAGLLIRRNTSDVNEASPSSVFESTQPEESFAPAQTNPASTTPAPTTTLSPGSNAACNDQGCAPYDRLVVVPGATDFYVGAEQLGEPTTHLDMFEGLTRCAELATEGRACARIEGIAGVGLTDYADQAGGSIVIGTTFATVTPAEYAQAWGPTQGGGEISQVTVRGHDGVTYLNEDRPAIVWTERPGVLVWVVVSGEFSDQLMPIAEGVRSVTGPSTIPHRVLVPGLLAVPWDTVDNDSDGLLVALVEGVECVGYGHVDRCGTAVGDRVAVRTRKTGPILEEGGKVVDGILVVGSTPVNATSVNVTFPTFTVASDTTAFPPYASRFFAFVVPYSPPNTVEWVSADGEPIDSGPVTLPGGFVPDVGAPIAIINASGVANGGVELETALRQRGFTVTVLDSPNIVDETMLMPIGKSTVQSNDLLNLIGVGGFDTWSQSLVESPLPTGVLNAIVVGADGGPELPLPLPTGLG